MAYIVNEKAKVLNFDHNQWEQAEFADLIEGLKGNTGSAIFIFVETSKRSSQGNSG